MSTKPRKEYLWPDKILSKPRFNMDTWPQLIPEVDYFIHVGAGIHETQTCEAKIFNLHHPQVPIVGFEPNPPRYEYLIEQKYPGDLYRLGLWEDNGTLDFYISQGHMCSSTPPPPECKNQVEEGFVWPCPVVRLDDLVQRTERKFQNAFIWADIEGDEVRMLRGADSLLDAGQIMGVLVEIDLRNNTAPNNHRATYEEIEKFLQPYGFSLRYVHESVDKKGPIADMIFLK